MVPAHQSCSNQHRRHQQPWRREQNHASNHRCYCYHRHLDQQHLIKYSSTLVSSFTSDDSIVFDGANHMSDDYSNYSYYYRGQSCLGSDVFLVSSHGQMADDHPHHHQLQLKQLESRTSSINDEAGSTSSKDHKTDIADPEADDGWLQLTIGSQTHGCDQQLTSVAPAASQNNYRHVNDDKDRDQAQPHLAADAIMLSSTSSDSGLVELDLIPTGPESRSIELVKPPIFPLRPIFRQIPEIHGGPSWPVINYDYTRGGRDGGSTAASVSSSFGLPTSLYTQQTSGSSSSSSLLLHRDVSWTRTFWPAVATPQYSVGMMPSSFSSFSSSSAASFSSLRPLGPFFSRPLQVQFHSHAAGSSSDVIRVIDPPRRPHSGLWFILQASQNQVKEPFLPQISKGFLRIKDGRMTIRLVMKYLVNKLKLDSETEIEITCRGEQLAPLLTLQHVRDNIWSFRDAVTLLSDSSSTDHVMVLHYSRSSTA